MIRRHALSALGLLTLAACGSDDLLTDPGDESTRDDRVETSARLAAARALWQRRGPTRYRYTVRHLCFCAPAATSPTRLLVDRGVVVSAEQLDGTPVDVALQPTVDRLFDLIVQAIRDDAAIIRATYDPSFGYPTSLFIDQSQQIADEEQRYEASDLTSA